MPAGHQINPTDFVRVIAAAGANKTFHMVMTSGAMGQQLTMDIDADPGPTIADSRLIYHITMPPTLATKGVSTMDMIVVDGYAYLRMGQQTQGKYVRVTKTNPTGPFASLANSFNEQADPLASVRKNAKAITSVTRAGQQTIDGMATDVYDVVMDTAKLPASATSAMGTSTSALPATLRYKYWIGPGNLMRRVTATVSIATVTIDCTRWGEPVTIAAPPAGQIIDSADLSTAG
jgi:hypothetical protein